MKNTEAQLFASKETGLNVNIDRSKYKVLNGMQGWNAGRIHNE